MITAGVRHPSYEAVKDAANTAIARGGITVRGSTPRAGIEIWPSRRESLKAWFSSKDTLVKLNAGRAFACCEGALKAWTLTEDGSYRLGFVDKTTKQWIGLVENCRTAEVRIPTSMSAGDHENAASDYADDPPQQNEPEEDEAMEVPAAQPGAGVVRGSETQTPAGAASKMPRVLRPSASVPPTPGPAATPVAAPAPQLQEAAPSAA